MPIVNWIDLIFPLAGLLMAYFVSKVEERTLCVVGLFVFLPFYVFRFGIGQTVLDHRFAWIFFFMLFHNGLLYIIAAQMCRFMNSPMMTARLYLTNVMLVNFHGFRSLQGLWEDVAEGYLSINALIFFHLVLFVFLGVFLNNDRPGYQGRTLVVALSPLPYALALGLALSFREFEIPYSVLQRIDLLFEISAPFAWLVVGLAWGRQISLLQWGESAALLPGLAACILLRLLASPLLAIGVVALMGMEDPSLRQALALSAAAPTSVFAILLVGFYRRANEVRFTVLCIVLTAVLSLAAQPFWEHVVNYLFPLPPVREALILGD